MRAAGLDDNMIACVSQTLRFYQSTGFGRPGKEKLRSILRQHKVQPIDIHLQQAEALYMRGMSAALLNTERRWSGARERDASVRADVRRCLRTWRRNPLAQSAAST
ncbi:hypothetical protein HNQ75_003215 [Rhizobium flavum]|uniref:Uncharacterized protein n=2 Tax=Pseudorhizobium flavum TaxID=1335061 RepID=A0A7W9YZJ2_9HYPH|nr:hypothetical protein [Pseudorhizobium flavum]